MDRLILCYIFVSNYDYFYNEIQRFEKQIKRNKESEKSDIHIPMCTHTCIPIPPTHKCVYMYWYLPAIDIVYDSFVVKEIRCSICFLQGNSVSWKLFFICKSVPVYLLDHNWRKVICHHKVGDVCEQKCYI